MPVPIRVTEPGCRVDGVLVSLPVAILVDSVAGLVRAREHGREAILRHLDESDRLEPLCDNLPDRELSALIDGIEDPALRARIQAFRDSSGPSLSEVYEDEAVENIREGDDVAGYGWTLLETAHNGLTGGFLGEHDAAWQARREGLISGDEYWTRTGLSTGKTAAVMAGGGAAGAAGAAWGEGLALGLRTSRTAATILGGALGGATGGVGAQATSDLYGEVLQGQEGFSSPEAYVDAVLMGAGAGAATSAMATMPGEVAGRLKAYARSQKLPADAWQNQAASWVETDAKCFGQAYERKYPGLDNLLTRLRGAGTRSGLRVSVTMQELRLLVSAGLLSESALAESFERCSKVWANDRVDTSRPLLKILPQSEVHALYGDPDFLNGTVTPRTANPTARGFAATVDEVQASNPSTDGEARATVGIDGDADFYERYKDSGDALFAVVFRTNVELDVPLPQDVAGPDTPLGTRDPKTANLSGTGRTPVGAQEGILPPDSPIEILDIRPIGDPRVAYPLVPSKSYPPAQPLAARNLPAPLAATTAPRTAEGSDGRD